MMAYVATQPLRWGEDTIAAGAPVPADEPGRDYASLLHLGQIREVDDTASMSDSEAASELKKARARIAELETAVRVLDAGDGADTPEPVEVPDGVTPGETPGWPLGVFIIPLSDEQREQLAQQDVTGTLSPEQAESLGIGPFRVRVILDSEALAHGKSDAGDGAESDDDLPEGVTATGGGWFELPNGEKVHGRRALDEALSDAK